MLQKLLKSKRNISVIIILDILIICLISHFFQNKILLLLIIILLHFIILITFSEVILKVHIVNFEKIYSIFANKKIKKRLKKDAVYLKKLEIETFDGSSSLTHPSLLYFEKGFNGYKYLMAYTPYDNNNIELENPCIVVSNDGINFEIPKGVKNPLLPIIKVSSPAKYYNDPFLFYNNNTLEIWYRITTEDKELKNDVYRICSVDGISWSEPEKMISNDGSCYMSLSIVKNDNLYYMYYFDIEYRFNMRTSKDLVNWSSAKKINIEGFSDEYWHGEVRFINNHFEVLFVTKNYNLYLAKSEDGINFEDIMKIKTYYVPKEYFYQQKYLYKSSILYVDNKVYLYIPFAIKKLNYSLKQFFYKKWRLTLSILEKSEFENIIGGKDEK